MPTRDKNAGKILVMFAKFIWSYADNFANMGPSILPKFSDSKFIVFSLFSAGEGC